ncbi:MAG: hypothetical protein IT423_07515 [Pirellulaceae bacterium]|nr:hypothetical protein [Pirellulaceae bacterium]
MRNIVRKLKMMLLQTMPLGLVGMLGGYALMLGPSISRAAEPIRVEYLWQSQPTLPFVWGIIENQPMVRATPGQVQSEHISERMSAAQAVLRVPKSPGFDQAQILTSLINRLSSGEPDLLVRAEMIAAVCELDNGQHAAMLWKLSSGERLLQPIVERACIGWRNNQPLAQWRARLKSMTASEQELLQAVDGLRATGTAEDVPQLKRMVTDATLSISLRLGCAHALGQLSNTSELELAKQLRGSGAQHAELMAVHVLASSPPKAVTEFVQDILNRSAPEAQRAAYRWLCEHDQIVAQKRAMEFIKNVDPEMRSMAILQITAADNSDTLPALFDVFSDEHPARRNQAREQLLICSERSPEHLQSIAKLLTEALKTDQWRPVEQAMRLAVELQRAEHVDRLLELLDHPRQEVCITAGWALRHLATEEDTLRAMLAHAELWTNKLGSVTEAPTVEEPDRRRVAHLLEAFGHRKYEPAKDLALKYVPKNLGMGLITRMTGIWACGKLWEQGENEKLTRELEARIADKNNLFSELESIRFAATLALGWIADTDSRQALVVNDEPRPSPIHFATAWALSRVDQRASK